MKTMTIKKIFPYLVVAFFLLSFPVMALAAEDNSENLVKKVVVLEKNQVVDEDYFAYGESVTLSGTVNGDAYLGGGTVLVDGVVRGDLFVGAGTFTFLGEVTGDLRLAGGEIVVDGRVGKNLTLAGGNATVTQSAQVGGSLLAFTGNLEVNGPLSRGARIYTGRALLGNKIGGNVRGSVGELSLSSKAVIDGDLEYESPSMATMASQATVSGKILHKPTEEKKFGAERIKWLVERWPQVAKGPVKKSAILLK